MTAKEIAVKMRQDDVREKSKDAEVCGRLSSSRRAQELECCEWVEECLHSFGKEFRVNKRWFGGSDYWTIRRDETVLLSCVLKFVSGAWDPSDDYRGIPYEQWEVMVCRGSWGGPHDKRGSAASRKESLNEEVAKIMKEFV